GILPLQRSFRTSRSGSRKRTRSGGAALRNELDPDWSTRPVELNRYHGHPSLPIETTAARFAPASLASRGRVLADTTGPDAQAVTAQATNIEELSALHVF